MAVVTVRPNATLANQHWQVIGPSAHGAVSDDSDATYIQSTLVDEIRFGFPNPSIPSGALVKSMALRVRGARVGGSCGAGFRLTNAEGELGHAGGVMFWGSPVTWVAIAAKSTPESTGIVVGLGKPFAQPTNIRIHEVYVEVAYTDPPEATVLAPTGTLTETNLPLVSWERTLDPDGGEQTHFQVRIMDGSTVVHDSGERMGQDLSYRVPDALPDGSYTAEVRIAQTPKGQSEPFWSDFDSEAFTVTVDAPGDPDLALTPEDSEGRIRIDLAETAGDADADRFELQALLGDEWLALRTVDGDGLVDLGNLGIRRNTFPRPSFEDGTTDGWQTAGAGVTIANVTEEAFAGTRSLKVTTPGSGQNEGAAISNANGTADADVSSPNACSVRIKAPAGATLQVQHREFNDTTFVGETNVNFTGTGHWQEIRTSRVHGATGNKIRLRIRTVTSTQAVAFYIDALLCEPGRSQAGGYFDGSFPNARWVGAAQGSHSEQLGTRAYDLEAPNVEALANQLPDPGFEDATLGEWSAMGGATVTNSTEFPHTGARHLRVVTPGAGTGEGLEIGSIPAGPGVTHRVAAWVRAPLGATLRLSLAERDSGGGIVGSDQTDFIGTDHYQLVVVERQFTAAGAAARVRLNTQTTDQAITFFVDDCLFAPLVDEMRFLRARALTDNGDGNLAGSQWVTSSQTWEDALHWWIKNAADPSLALKIKRVQIDSQPSEARDSGATVHKVLGRSDPVVVHDAGRIAPSGELTLALDTQAERDTFNALYDEGAVVLIQAPDGDRWPDRWVALIASHDSAGMVDKLAVEETFEAFTWQEIARPPGELVAWPE